LWNVLATGWSVFAVAMKNSAQAALRALGLTDSGFMANVWNAILTLANNIGSVTNPMVTAAFGFAAGQWAYFAAGVSLLQVAAVDSMSFGVGAWSFGSSFLTAGWPGLYCAFQYAGADWQLLSLFGCLDV